MTASSRSRVVSRHARRFRSYQDAAWPSRPPTPLDHGLHDHTWLDACQTDSMVTLPCTWAVGGTATRRSQIGDIVVALQRIRLLRGPLVVDRTSQVSPRPVALGDPGKRDSESMKTFGRALALIAY